MEHSENIPNLLEYSFHTKKSIDSISHLISINLFLDSMKIE